MKTDDKKNRVSFLKTKLNEFLAVVCNQIQKMLIKLKKTNQRLHVAHFVLL